MALTLVTSGSTTTDGTEQTLTTQTTALVYQFAIDTANMQNGDVIEIKMKTKVRSGDSSRVAYYATYSHAQSGEPNKYSIPIPANVELIITIKRVAGGDRAYPWALLSF